MNPLRLYAPLVLAFATASAGAADQAVLEAQVREAEIAFAGAMAARDHTAFSEHIAAEAVFFDGNKPLHGKEAVVAAWKSFFERVNAPFSWTPETIEVLDSGTLAHSSGPVFDADGKKAATYNSVWRLEKDGKWRVVFDKACGACPCAAASAAAQQQP